MMKNMIFLPLLFSAISIMSMEKGQTSPTDCESPILPHWKNEGNADSTPHPNRLNRAIEEQRALRAKNEALKQKEEKQKASFSSSSGSSDKQNKLKVGLLNSLKKTSRSPSPVKRY